MKTTEIAGEVDECGWLIESVHETCVEWIKISNDVHSAWEWTRNASEALRFSRKQDAEKMIRFFKIEFVNVHAVEHVWSTIHKRKGV